jgi:hypothetical protein
VRTLSTLRTVRILRLLASIERINEKHLFVEQETYPGARLERMRRDYAYISALEY